MSFQALLVTSLAFGSLALHVDVEKNNGEHESNEAACEYQENHVEVSLLQLSLEKDYTILATNASANSGAVHQHNQTINTSVSVHLELKDKNAAVEAEPLGLLTEIHVSTSTISSSQGVSLCIIILVILAFVLVGLLFCAQYITGPMAKNMVNRDSEDMLGMKITVGNVSVSLFSGLVCVQDLTIHNPGGFEHKAKHKFKPGRLGVVYDEDGIVREVIKNGPAHAEGIKKGDLILKVGADPFSQETLTHMEESGGSGYEVTFQVGHFMKIENMSITLKTCTALCSCGRELIIEKVFVEQADCRIEIENVEKKSKEKQQSEKDQAESNVVVKEIQLTKVTGSFQDDTTKLKTPAARIPDIDLKDVSGSTADIIKGVLESLVKSIKP